MLPERTSSKARRTRATIIDAALALFREKGFEETTMREVADRAGLAVGAAYYHFRTKDEILLALYEGTIDNSLERARFKNAKSADFADRVRDALDFRLAQLRPYKAFLGPLAGHALVPGSPLSPFAQETEEIRLRELALFEEIIHGSSLKVALEFKSHLPRFLWLYQMSVISFWLRDQSPLQERTERLIGLSLSLIMKLFAVTRVPVLRQANGLILSLLQLAAGPGASAERHAASA